MTKSAWRFPAKETPAVGGGRGRVLETGCRRVSRRFDTVRGWLAFGKEDASLEREANDPRLADKADGSASLR
jgi:hypothetical protein